MPVTTRAMQRAIDDAANAFPFLRLPAELQAAVMANAVEDYYSKIGNRKHPYEEYLTCMKTLAVCRELKPLVKQAIFANHMFTCAVSEMSVSYSGGPHEQLPPIFMTQFVEEPLFLDNMQKVEMLVYCTSDEGRVSIIEKVESLLRTLPRLRVLRVTMPGLGGTHQPFVVRDDTTMQAVRELVEMICSETEKRSIKLSFEKSTPSLRGSDTGGGRRVIRWLCGMP